jgi:hypothetical protein
MMEVIDWKVLTPEQRDERVAKFVMGWQPKECDGQIGEQPVSPDGWFCQHCGVEGSWGDDFIHEERPPRYTQSMDTAWLILAKMKEQLFFELLQECITRRHSELDGLIAWPDVLWFLDAEDICIAALRSFGMEVQA